MIFVFGCSLLGSGPEPVPYKGYGIAFEYPSDWSKPRMTEVAGVRRLELQSTEECWIRVLLNAPTETAATGASMSETMKLLNEESQDGRSWIAQGQQIELSSQAPEISPAVLRRNIAGEPSRAAIAKVTHRDGRDDFYLLYHKVQTAERAVLFQVRSPIDEWAELEPALELILASFQVEN